MGRHEMSRAESWRKVDNEVSVGEGPRLVANTSHAEEVHTKILRRYCNKRKICPKECSEQQLPTCLLLR